EIKPITSIIGNGRIHLFDVEIHGQGIPAFAGWLVSNFTFAVTPGVTTFLSAESVNLTQGRPDDTIFVSVSAPGFFPGDVVEVSLTGANGSAPVFIHGAPVRAYVSAPSSRVQIDGLFADWVSRDVPDTDPSPVSNPDLNIVRYGAATSNATAFFHVHVAGTLLGGSIPER